MFHDMVSNVFSTGFERTDRIDRDLQLDDSDLSLHWYNGIIFA